MMSDTPTQPPAGHPGYTYADAGVSIAAGNALVRAIAPLAKATRRPAPMPSLADLAVFLI